MEIKVAEIKGVPRTAENARAFIAAKGIKEERPTAADLSAPPLVVISSVGVRHGDIGKVLPGSKPGTKIVCYFDEGTGQYTDCHVVHG